MRSSITGTIAADLTQHILRKAKDLFDKEAKVLDSLGNRDHITRLYAYSAILPNYYTVASR